MEYNDYQKLHYNSLFPKVKKQPKKYALFNGSERVLEGEYGLLVHKKRQMVADGRLEYLLKIKAI